jgi:hypothetical protein
VTRGISIKCNICKKEAKLICDNYRGICLRPTTYKTVTYYKKRLEPIAEQVIGEYLAGFRKDRSTMGHVFTMKETSEKFWEHNVGLFQIHIDFRQVYDHINREYLQETLLPFDIPVYIIRLVRLRTTSTGSQVRVQTELTDAVTMYVCVCVRGGT